MASPVLHVISLRYSSWSMRALLPLLHAGAVVEVKTVELPLSRQGDPLQEASSQDYLRAAREQLGERRELGSVTGCFPVLWIDDTPIHEALAIAEWAADSFPEASLWPDDTLQRARARALSLEMASGFRNLRNHMSCHLKARVPNFVPDGPTQLEIDRVFELLLGALARSGGPFLFGDFGIADAMYFPVLSRFDTYGVALPPGLQAYHQAVFAHAPVQALLDLAQQAPAIPVYDDYIKNLGGILL